MKLLSLLITLLMTASIHAGTFSAFAHGDKLYVTMLLDNCNAHSLDLEVDGFCRDDRLTKNYAPFCGAEVVVLSTQRYCVWSQLEPVTFELSLRKSKIAREARELTLRNGDEEITLEIEQK